MKFSQSFERFMCLRTWFQIQSENVDEVTSLFKIYSKNSFAVFLLHQRQLSLNKLKSAAVAHDRHTVLNESVVQSRLIGKAAGCKYLITRMSLLLLRSFFGVRRSSETERGQRQPAVNLIFRSLLKVISMSYSDVRLF